MAEIISYLQNLRVSPQLEKTRYAGYLRNTRLVILLIFLFIAVGIVSFLSLPRVLNPQIKIPIVIVSTSLPGASSKDIETLVTIPLEDSVNNLAHIKSLTSTSQDSVAVITIEFESGIDPEKAKSDVQSAVTSVTTLPSDATTPHVEKLDFENVPIWTFSVSSGHDYLSLSRFSKTLRDTLKDLSTIDRVEAPGLDSQEIQIVMHPTALATYGINPVTIAQAIKAATGSFPGGVITTKTSSFGVSVDPTVTTLDALRHIRIQTHGTAVFLSDIATIQERMNPGASTSLFANHTASPVQTIRFDIYKKSTANITEAVAEAKHATEILQATYKNQFTIASVLNSGEEIDTQFFDLVRDLLITVSLVFLILFLFLGLRQAIVASVAIPFTFLITFTVMHMAGLSLSFIAFFSLLLSLGLLVDDTIVVISALTSYYRTHKFTPLQASLLVWRDFRLAIITTTLTTVWAFVPLLLATGIIGEFIKPIPIVVASTLIASLAIALFITPPLIIVLLNGHIEKRIQILFRVIGVGILLWLFFKIAPQGGTLILALFFFVSLLFVFYHTKPFLTKEATYFFHKLFKKRSRNITTILDTGVIHFGRFEKMYRRSIDRILSSSTNRRKTIIAVVIFSVFSYFLVPTGLVKSEFFPKSDQEFLYISLTLPQGTNKEVTLKEVTSLSEDLRHNSEVKFVTATIGLGVDPGRGYASASDNTALFTLVLPPLKERTKTSMDIAEQFRHTYAHYTKGTIDVVEESGGPPAGSDIQMKLLGPDLQTLDMYADKLKAHLEKQSGVTSVKKSIESGTSKIVFIPNNQKLLDADITQDQIGLWLRVYASGFTLQSDAKLDGGSDEKHDIVLRTDTKQEEVQNLQTITIPSSTGPLSLLSLGKFVLKPNPTLITREDGKRTMSVTAGVKPGVSAPEKNAELAAFVTSLHLPVPYSWKTGGANEENQRSVNSILQAMILSFFLIIVTMVLQFSSFRKAFIVMLVIPLSISGVFIVFALTHTPLSFPALIGILALFGIVVKNSILIVDKINQNLKHNMEFKHAIVEAAESRLEPITLTSFATIVGLIPITLSDPLWRGLGGAIIAGLFFSGSMMLFFIPVVYFVMFHPKKK